MMLKEKEMTRKEINEYIAEQLYGWKWSEEPIYRHNQRVGMSKFWNGPKKYENNIPDFIEEIKKVKEILKKLDEKGIKIEGFCR